MRYFSTQISKCSIVPKTWKATVLARIGNVVNILFNLQLAFCAALFLTVSKVHGNVLKCLQLHEISTVLPETSQFLTVSISKKAAEIRYRKISPNEVQG